MREKLLIDGQELIVLLTIEDNYYGEVKKCYGKKNKVYVVNGKLVTDQEIIKALNDRYEVKIPKEWINKS